MPDGALAPQHIVDALQALRGLSFVTAVGLVAEIGDIRRFAHPRHLMAFLGLVPSAASPRPTVATAVARELTGFTWAIAREVPAPPA